MELILINKKLHLFFAGFVTFLVFGLLLLGIIGANHIYPDKVVSLLGTGFTVIMLGCLLVISTGLAYSGYVGKKKGVCYVKRTYRPRIHEQLLETSAYKNIKVLRGSDAIKANKIKMMAAVTGAVIFSWIFAMVLLTFLAQITGMLQ